MVLFGSDVGPDLHKDRNRYSTIQPAKLMAEKWPGFIYDYEHASIAHSDIEALDLAEGKLWKYKFCKNPKNFTI